MPVAGKCQISSTFQPFFLPFLPFFTHLLTFVGRSFPARPCSKAPAKRSSSRQFWRSGIMRRSGTTLDHVGRQVVENVMAKGCQRYRKSPFWFSRFRFARFRTTKHLGQVLRQERQQMRQQLRLSKRMERVTCAPLCEPTRKKHLWYRNVHNVWTWDISVVRFVTSTVAWYVGSSCLARVMSCSHSSIFAMMPSESDHCSWPLTLLVQCLRIPKDTQGMKSKLSKQALWKQFWKQFSIVFQATCSLGLTVLPPSNNAG